MAEQKRLAGVVGFFDEPHDILEAMPKVRDANFRSFDAFTPFPVHGMDDAMGLKRSILPYITFTFGISGTVLAFLLQYWTAAVDWPLNVGGKPFNSWPAFVPVMFELTILFAGLSTVFGMWALNSLPNVTKKAIDPAITRDKFAIFIGAPTSAKEEKEDSNGRYKKFSDSEAQALLEKVGARGVRKVYVEGWF